MRQRRRWFLCLAMWLMASLISNTANSQTTSINIKSAIETAMANNYSLKADSMNILTAGYQVNIAKADFLPQVNYNSKTEYNPAIPSQMLPGNVIGQPSKDLVPVQFGTRYSMNNGFEATQAIIRKSSRYQVGVARLNTGIAQTKHQLTKEELVYQVATAFYALQATAEQIRTTGIDYKNIKEISVIAKAQYENGVLKRIDVESLEINAANKQSQLNQLQTTYNEQLAYFKYLLGISQHTAIRIAENIATDAGTVTGGGTRLWNRNDVVLYRQMIQSKELELKSIKAERKPSLSTYFRFNYQSQNSEPGDAFRNDYWFKSATIGLTSSIPLFDGFRRKNRINVATAQLQQLQFNSELKQQQANTEWTTATETLNNDREQVKVTQQNLLLAEKVFTSRKALYAEGVTTLIELLDAERELSQSRNLHTQALINVQTSTVNAHKANGTLLTEFLNTL